MQLSHELFLPFLRSCEIWQINPMAACPPRPRRSAVHRMNWRPAGQTKSIEPGSHGSMEAGAAPLIATAPSVSLNLKTKASLALPVSEQKIKKHPSRQIHQILIQRESNSRAIKWKWVDYLAEDRGPDLSWWVHIQKKCGNTVADLLVELWPSLYVFCIFSLSFSTRHPSIQGSDSDLLPCSISAGLK